MNPRVVVIGCGFGGLWAAQGLARAAVDVTVIDVAGVANPLNNAHRKRNNQ